jgi:lysophospholipase L1-like esterase
MTTRLFGAAVLAALALSAVPAADKPDPWESAIAAFEKQEKDKPLPPEPIIFVGSSSIRLWDLGKSFPGLPVVNRGFGGSHLADSVRFAPRILLKQKPRTIVVYAGDNDLAAGKSPEKVFGDFQELVRVVKAELPRTKILYLAIKPSPKRWALEEKVRKVNALIAEACKKDRHLVFVDVFTPMLGPDGKPKAELFRDDNLHMNAKGYELWTSLVKPLLK